MRLINTQTLEVVHFSEVVPEEIPYAVLSHTWGADEVTYEDMRDPVTARSRLGFAKIEATCQMAVDNGLQYAWVDTCCIDKSSSAELSEAINSMFRWYQNAVVCFVYLEDLLVENRPRQLRGLRDCRWFRRGWTLQELVAPKDVMLFDKEWHLLGTKEGLADEIEFITGIDRLILTSAMPLSAVPLAKRLSWAAGRQTTRVEDRAYSLLGIFDVNLSLIYGEGAKAFLRVQEEIYKKSTDLSLLAWQAQGSTMYRGILAGSPDEFHACGNVVLSEDQFRFRDEITMTNKGLKVSTAVQYSREDTYVLDLHCYRQQEDGRLVRIGVYLRRALDTYFRERPEEMAQVARLPGSRPRPIFLATTMDQDHINSTIATDARRRIYVRFPAGTPRCKTSDVRAVPEIYWEGHEHYFSISGLVDFQCFVRFCVTSRAPPTYPDYRDNDESTQFVLFLSLVDKSTLHMSLYAETGLHNSPRPQGFIDPFKDIEAYGPLGDPFSMSVLNPGDHEDRSVSMIHRNHLNDYVISAQLDQRQGHPPFRVTVVIDQDHPENGVRPLNGPPERIRDLRRSAAPLQRHPYYQ